MSELKTGYTARIHHEKAGLAAFADFLSTEYIHFPL